MGSIPASGVHARPVQVCRISHPPPSPPLASRLYVGGPAQLRGLNGPERSGYNTILKSASAWARVSPLAPHGSTVAPRASTPQTSPPSPPSLFSSYARRPPKTSGFILTLLPWRHRRQHPNASGFILTPLPWRAILPLLAFFVFKPCAASQFSDSMVIWRNGYEALLKGARP